MERIAIETRRFGTLEVDAGELLHFDSLPGFPAARRFALVRHDRSTAFGWLVCADDPELAFAVASPWDFFPDYKPAIARRDLLRLEAVPDELEGMEVLTIACLRSDAATLNLAAPIVVNPRNRRAIQAILERSDLPIRAPVPTTPPAPETEEGSP